MQILNLKRYKFKRKKQGYIFLVLLLFIVCLYFISCVSSDAQVKDNKSSKAKSGGPPPAWMQNPEILYPDDKYLSVIGEGDTLRDAKSNAMSSLSQIFKTSVKVESKAIQRYKELESESGTSFEKEKDLTEQVTLGSEQTLFNVKFGESYVDKNGRLYIIGYINRRETGKIYKEKIFKNSDSILFFKKRSDESEGIIKKYAFIDASVLYSMNNEVLLEQLTIISQLTKKMIHLPYSHNELLKSRLDVAGDMVFNINIQNDIDNKIANIVTKVLSEQAFTISSTASLKVHGKVNIENVQLDNKYENVRWHLTLELKDEKNNVIVSFNKNQRESAISRTEAISRAYRQMEKNIKAMFMGEIIKYFDSFILKNT